MKPLEPVDSSLFFSRQDPKDPRLGELVGKTASSGGVAVIGYRDDEGIKLNGGRLGAADGPVEIRRALYRMTPHSHRELRPIWDLGNVGLTSGDLNARHALARQTVAAQLTVGARVLALGGGNDYAYADGMGFFDSTQGEKPLVINVDAHFDVRDTSRGFSSGTPFYRLLESGVDFDFVELGIQAQCNSRAHWDYVESKGGLIISLEEILSSSLSLCELTLNVLAELTMKKRPTFLAIDMDAFSWPYAMGTSAAWPIGLDPNQFWVLLNALLQRLDVRVMGLYEVSPALDQGGGTAKLAAQLAHGYLHV